MSALLLDSSVWVAALDPSDPHHGGATQLVAQSEAGRTLAALDLTLYEVANVAVRSWRSPEDAATLVRLVRDACPSTIAKVDEQLVDRAVALAERHGLSIYDASYVAVAELNDWTLVSGDHVDLVRPALAITPEAALAA